MEFDLCSIGLGPNEIEEEVERLGGSTRVVSIRSPRFPFMFARFLRDGLAALQRVPIRIVTMHNSIGDPGQTARPRIVRKILSHRLFVWTMRSLITRHATTSSPVIHELAAKLELPAPDRMSHALTVPSVNVRIKSSEETQHLLYEATAGRRPDLVKQVAAQGRRERGSSCHRDRQYVRTGRVYTRRRLPCRLGVDTAACSGRGSSHRRDPPMITAAIYVGEIHASRGARPTESAYRETVMAVPATGSLPRPLYRVAG
jgi:hypothetical protein